VKRRQLLQAAASIATGPLQAPSLRDAARRAGIQIGSSSEIDLALDPAYAALIAANCSLFAPNMSWQRLSPAPDQHLIDLDPNLVFARRNGLRLTGYHLLWHQRLPDWFGALDRRATERAIVAHIRRVGAQFGAETAAWNVVNEAIRPADGMPGGLRRSPLLEKFGSAFFDIAFEAARDAEPSALRIYNDYDLELQTSNDSARRRCLLGLLDELARRSVPIQAVGLQSHLRTRSFDRFDAASYRRFLDELASRRLDVFITELDVQDQVAGDVGMRDSQVADIYRRFLETALAQPRVRAVVFWGLGDRYSWLNDPARTGFVRADHQPGRPLPFGPDLRPAPALQAIEDTLAHAQPR